MTAVLDFVVGRWFKFFVVPLISLVITIFIRIISRRDAFAKPRRDDLAVGVDLMLGAWITFVLSMIDSAVRFHELNKKFAELGRDNSQKTTLIALQPEYEALAERFLHAGVSTVAWVFAIFGVSYIIRIWGWDGAASEPRPTLFCGVIVPMVIGLLAVYVAMVGAS